MALTPCVQGFVAELVLCSSNHANCGHDGQLNCLGQDEPIQNALHMLAYASTSKCIETLKSVDPTQSSFACGICFTLQDAWPLKLRKAALFFLPLIAEKWFNTPDPIMTPNETKCLCVDWASTVDEVRHSTEQLIASVRSEQQQFTPEDGIILEDDTLTLVSKERQPEVCV